MHPKKECIKKYKVNFVCITEGEKHPLSIYKSRIVFIIRVRENDFVDTLLCRFHWHSYNNFISLFNSYQ